MRLLRAPQGTLRAGVSLLSLGMALALAAPAWANDMACKDLLCQPHTRGQRMNDAAAVDVAIGANTEAQGPADANAKGYSISVDGVVVDGSKKLADRQRLEDRKLDAVDIQVKFDGLEVKPILNVSTVPIRQSYRGGDKIEFFASTNYGDWISRAEIRLFDADGDLKLQPLATLPISGNGVAAWTMPGQGPAKLKYVLRVYDRDGRFDETRPLSLTRATDDFAQHEPQDSSVAPGAAEDRTAFRNIQLYGGSVTVFGRNVPQGNRVLVMGQPVPVDAEGKFVTQQIMPPGDHNVSVQVQDLRKKGLSFSRDINIPSSEWFYVALADLTVGHRFADNNVQAVRPGEFPGVYTKGRLAFYLKGKIKGRALLTASADTGENDLQSMFTGLDGKDPRQFLKRIDPSKYYPVYGDDSTSVEDAPTQGKFYVRLERGDSHVMWGNFKTQITGTRFLRNERALYGASGVYKSEDTVANGERRTEAQVYAALPGTLPARDLLRGTGGSAYFLKHQDITVGSETVSVVTVDAVTGAVLSRQLLRYGVDYTIDYIQGLVLLTNPLPSTVAGGTGVSPGALGGNQLNLAVSYEYTPAASNVDGYSAGGRAQQWLGDHVRVGVTGQVEKTGGADQKVAGADIHIEHSPGTYLEGEAAVSQGTGFGLTQSADGGLTLSDTASAGLPNVTAMAYSVNGRVDLHHIIAGDGYAAGHFTHQDLGFTSLDAQVPVAKDDWGASLHYKTSDKSDLIVDYAAAHYADGHADDVVDAHADIATGPHFIVSPGVRYSNHQDPTVGAADSGQRMDLGLRGTYLISDTQKVYLYGQGTAWKDGTRIDNNRVGVGGETLLSEKTSLAGEVSYGTGGLGGLAKVTYKPTADDQYYFGYALDRDRDMQASSPLVGDDWGKFITGARHRYSEEWTIFAEDSYDLFGVKKTLAQTYGVTYTPSARWSYGANVELGHIVDGTINPTTLLKNSDFDRKAFSGSVGYKDPNGNAGHAKVEVRFENSEDHTRDLTQYLTADNFVWKANPNWRLLFNLDAVVTDASDTTRGGTYVEGSVGYAYRPVLNDRFNMLARYTYLYDLPAANQVDVSGTTLGPQQRSHIFAVDTSYDVTQIITLGAKYGFRIGDTRARDGSSDWTTSSAHLGVIRADLNIVHNWDAVAELRALWTPSANTTDLGALVAVYRHFGDNFKLGVGYNFGRFSDDLRDQSFTSQGIFINAVGQF